MIEIIGEVNSPGFYQYVKNYKLKDYLKFSGGLNAKASKYNSYIVYPNGKSKPIGVFTGSTNIPDGSKIVIVSKEEVIPFNITEYVTNLTSIYTDLNASMVNY